jgi:hypothetical protein
MNAMHLLPGTTFSSAKHRAEYNSEGKAAMTIGELEMVRLAGHWGISPGFPSWSRVSL